MEATKPPTSKVAKPFVEQARGDSWSAGQLRVTTSSEILRGGAGPDRISAGDSLQPLRWWPVGALLLALFYTLVGIEALTDPVYQAPDYELALLTFGSAALLVVGMIVRRRSFYLGTTLIVLGCPLALVPWWMLFPPPLAFLVILGATKRERRVFDKRVLFGVLLVLVTAIYVGVAVGVGTLVSSRNERNLLLPIAATAIAAVLFQPVRARLQRFANRLVYGNRATPYEVLAHFADRVAGTYATEDVLPKMARALQEGTGANRAEVWLRSGERLRLAASSPDEAASAEFYSACLQVILLSWLIVAVETRSLKQEPTSLKILVGGVLGAASTLAVLLCLVALGEPEGFGIVSTSFIFVATWLIAFIALISLIFSLFEKPQLDDVDDRSALKPPNSPYK